MFHAFVHITRGVAPGAQAQLTEGEIPVVAADEGIHPTERRAAPTEQPGDVGDTLGYHHRERAARGMAVDVYRVFSLGKLPARRFLDRLFEGGRPGTHSVVKFRAFLGR